MQEEAESVAFIFRGEYIHPACARSESERAVPVHSRDMPSVAWCYMCKTLIMSPAPCVFCDIVAGRERVEWIVQPDTWHDAVAFVPLNPVVEGHCLIVSKLHVRDFSESPEVHAAVSQRASELMRWTRRSMVLLTTKGKEAGQEIMHLHLHLIPREKGDGLRLLQRRVGKKGDR